MSSNRAFESTVDILSVDTTKICTKCGVDKQLKEFCLIKRRLDGHNNICRVCVSNNPRRIAFNREHLTTLNGRFNKAKWKSKIRKIEFTISLEAYVVIASQPCYYCDNRLGDRVNRGVGLDRLNNAIGYVIGNVVSCCGRCNRLKSYWMTPEETKVAVNALLSYRSLKGKQ
jgi:hypothetical protein